MSKINKAFENGKAFIGFVTCGDPDLDTTKKIIKQMEQNGADLIELGIPFSDPTAEGPVIQGANIRALANGVTTDDIFVMAKQVREEVSVPMVFMTYANVVFSYGTDKFASKCSEIGMDGVILPDIPYEEKDEFADTFKKYGLDFISLVAPTSDSRIEMIASQAEGFVYCVSSLGVTGERKSISESAGEIAQQVKKYTDKPAAIGFGISTPEQAREMAKYADGVIVGSAIVRIVAEHGTDSPKYVGEYVKSMKDAIR
ncbi:MAG: tryptophan synthase subunit alpha [Faecalibacterium sp.]|nr:tryptophan synthase subunit alpha [Ruminococcus sp.]MCM1391987.1 tryptophan synthase subunit alpha [Ruminococcus sp.]MCM1485582.1 tryptophan synthase subunit alpha [Faecalibacterium sp.]